MTTENTKIMEKIDTGGPAFPAQPFDRDFESGMTLRDWFAGHALTGLLASGHFTLPHQEEENDGAWMTFHEHPWDENGEEIFPAKMRFDFPEAAWACADAMLAERNRK